MDTARTPGGTAMSSGRDLTTIDEVIDARAVTVVYQPVIRLDTGATVGYEAFARGPEGTPWHAPEELFSAATSAGRRAELDWICRAAAYRAALDAELPGGFTLFVNTEAEAPRNACPAAESATIMAAQLRLRVVTEVRERDLVTDPLGLLADATACRGAGWGLALDDVGMDPRSLALLPLLAPDVVKLDGPALWARDSPDRAAVLHAVRAYAERTGAAILVERIESERDAQLAHAMGASLGQGWHLGRPGPLGGIGTPAAGGAVPFVAPPDPTANPTDAARTPFDIVATRRPTTLLPKKLLAGVSRHAQTEAVARNGEPPIVLVCLQDVRHLTPATTARLERIAASAALVVVFGAHVPVVAGRGVHGCALHTDDPLRAEWNVLVLGPHVAAALVARDLGDTGPDEGRRFTHAVTYDRDLVLQAARAVLDRAILR